MSDQPVSRRLVLGTLTTGVVGASLASASFATSADLALEGVSEVTAQGPREAALLAPLAAGSQILDWKVVAIEPLEMGAVRVQLAGESGVAFAVEVLARDGSPLAAKPPARTEKFALHVSNGGDGRVPTIEDQGLAAMALAQIVARNEAAVSDEGFLTHGARIEAHRVAMLEHTQGFTSRVQPSAPRADDLSSATPSDRA